MKVVQLLLHQYYYFIFGLVVIILLNSKYIVSSGLDFNCGQIKLDTEIYKLNLFSFLYWFAILLFFALLVPKK